MKLWHDLVEDIFYLNPEKRGAPSRVRLSGCLSPATNLLLNVFTNSITTKNLIVTYPSTILKPISLLSYLYASKTKRSVYVLSQSISSQKFFKPIDFHTKNYNLMCKDRGQYLFEEFPIGTVKDGTISACIYLPRASRDMKDSFMSYYVSNFTKKDKTRILFDTSEEDHRIVDHITKAEINTVSFKADFKINNGLFIFENIDRFVNSSYTCEYFIKWLEKFHKEDIKFLFHFSNTESAHISCIKEKFECLVLPLNKTLITENRALKNQSIVYFKMNESLKQENEFFNRLNIDTQENYGFRENIEVQQPFMKNGNLDLYIQNIRNVRKKINEDGLINKRIYYKIMKLTYLISNLLINPAKYKESFFDSVYGWRYLSFGQLINIFSKEISKEMHPNKLWLSYVLDNLFNLFLELKECKRYGEEKSFKRISKEHQILEIIHNTDNSENKLIATSTSYERNRLIETIQTKETNTIVLTLDQIQRSIFDRTLYHLFIPGPLRIQYFAEFLKAYKSIKILVYDGSNLKTALEQIKLVDEFSLRKERISMEYLHEIYNFLNLPECDIFQDFRDRLERDSTLEEKKITSEEEERDVGEQSINLRKELEKMIKSSSDFSSLNILEMEINEIENNDIKYNISNKEIEKFEERIYYNVLLERRDSGEQLSRKLIVGKPYLSINESTGDLEELTPKNLEPGSLIVILDDDERKTLLQLILEVYNFEEFMDQKLVEHWQSKLAEYIEYHDTQLEEFYQRYKEYGGKRKKETVKGWTKGSVLGPQNESDLRIIAKIIEDEYLFEEYKIMYLEIEKLRRIHRTVGKMIKKIATIMITGRINMSKLSFEELTLYDKISNGLYRIIEIKRIEN